MTKEQIKAFIAWLKTKDMYLAGNTFNFFLGTDRPAPLAEEDYETVIDDFLKDQS